MNASELLQQVKALSPRERRKFVRAVLSLEEGASSPAKAKAKKTKWLDVETRAKRIIGKRVRPNFIFLERKNFDGLVGGLTNAEMDRIVYGI